MSALCLQLLSSDPNIMLPVDELSMRSVDECEILRNQI